MCFVCLFQKHWNNPLFRKSTEQRKEKSPVLPILEYFGIFFAANIPSFSSNKKISKKQALQLQLLLLNFGKCPFWSLSVSTNKIILSVASSVPKLNLWIYFGVAGGALRNNLRLIN